MKLEKGEIDVKMKDGNAFGTFAINQFAVSLKIYLCPFKL